ncbi:MAG TPA: DUF6263 family protein [Prolixibacteraceae bacterium]|nr:DUF6263 family protein [Prolixibacteraceae bacterium]
MKTKLFTLLAISVLLICNSFQAQSKVLIRLNLQKGNTYEMTMASNNIIDQEMMGQKIKMDQKMNMVFSYHVLDILPNHNFLIEYSMVKMKLDMNINGQEITLDSENTDESNPMNEVLKGLDSLKLKFELSPAGKVEQVVGLEEYAKKLAGNQQIAKTMPMFLDDNNFKTFIGQGFSYFPEVAVGEGEKWTSSFKLPAMMNMETIMNFEVAAIEKDQISLNFTSDVNIDTPIEQGGMKMNMKMTGKQDGTMTIDTKDGWIRQSDLTQKFDMKMKMKNPQTGEDMEIPMVMNSVTKITVNKN